MERPSILIISDDDDFATAVTCPWTSELNAPSFSILPSGECARVVSSAFDLAILGHIEANVLESVAMHLQQQGKPGVLVSQWKGKTPRYEGLPVLPEIERWPDVLLVVVQAILQRLRIQSELERLQDVNVQLEREASLARYMLEVRHNLNNALTSILGNSDLILLEDSQLPAPMRSQVETIRNMGMRVNEILQRFSSLQKEMQLVEQQSNRRAAGTAAGL